MNPDAHTLTGAYALDALDPAERRLVDEHLRDCPPCRQEVRELRATAARLALAVAQDPPGQLRHRVLAEVHRTRQQPPAAPAGEPGPGKAWRWSARTRRAATAAAVAASIAVAVGTGALAVRNQAELDGARARLAQAHTQYEQVASLLAAPDSRATTVPAPGGTATLVTSRRLDRALLITTGLPTPDPAHDYQVWLIGSDGPRPAGLISSGPLLIGGLVDGEIVAVTLERAGGAPQPTTQPILKLELPT
ncbi:anti-sigma factor [Pseudonocardia eucalypti]|uniref:Regulator of SigK n=1 Tax=Pseudonocardia eucalypti TaxID=648755 RepID=A0ABP9PQ52_9PSEU|nr:anti-sigma factor RsiW [Pseudonocardia eucalypti]